MSSISKSRKLKNGYDTITTNGCGSHVKFNTLAGFVNLTLNSVVRNYKSSEKVKIQKSEVFTKYLYNIGKKLVFQKVMYMDKLLMEMYR